HQVRLDERIDRAIEYSVRISDFNSGAMVLDHSIRLQDVGPDLATPGNIFLVLRELLKLFTFLLLFEFEQSRAQDLHRHRAILMLGALVLAAHDDPRRYMRHAHRGVSLIDVLTTGTARAKRIDTQIGGVDYHFDFFIDGWEDENRRERGV